MGLADILYRVKQAKKKRKVRTAISKAKILLILALKQY